MVRDIMGLMEIISLLFILSAVYNENLNVRFMKSSL